MATFSGSVLIVCLILVGLTISGKSIDASGGSKGCCLRSVAECMVKGDEFEMDNEINRRQLATTTQYISYEALQQDTVPCSYKGASYYNCQYSEEVNPYDRGCTQITLCRS